MSAVDMRQPMNMAEHEHLALAAHTALYEMLNGTARREEWNELADCVNLVEALCDMRKLPADVEMYRVQRAIDGLALAVRRPEGRMGMHAMEAMALQHVVNTYDVALSKFSRGTFKEARDLVIRKIRLARAEANNGVLVIEP